MTTKQIMREYGKNKFTYRFLKRQGNVALYEVTTKEGINTGFEVYLVRTMRVTESMKRRWPLLVNFELYEQLPSNEDFGSHGWYFQTREAAERRYAELCQAQELKAGRKSLDVTNR